MSHSRSFVSLSDPYLSGDGPGARLGVSLVETDGGKLDVRGLCGRFAANLAQHGAVVLAGRLAGRTPRELRDRRHERQRGRLLR